MTEPSFESEPAAPEPTAGPKPDERNMALLAHLGALAGYVVGFGHILVPLVVWLVKKDESEFVRANALESLNFQISMTIWIGISVVLTVVLIGIPMLVLLGIVDLVCIVLATIKASNGEIYRYPLTLRLVK